MTNIHVFKTSPVTGESNGMDITCTEDQYESYLRGDGLIQDLLPEATVDQREFLISGCTPTCWESMFPPQNAAEQADSEGEMEETFAHPADCEEAIA